MFEEQPTRAIVGLSFVKLYIYWGLEMFLLLFSGESASGGSETFIDRIAENIDWLLRLVSLVSGILAITFFFLTLFCFSRKCRRVTDAQIKQYSSDGKYIRGLFVELNESKEYLRAFCFSSLWRKKAIRKYNTLFNDKLGKDFLKVYSERKVKLHLPSICSTKRIRAEIFRTKEFLGKVERRELDCNPDYTHTNLKYECFGGTYARAIERIDKMTSYLRKNYMVMTGTAGNGKSMLLCSIAEQLQKNKETVLFLNARDINDDLNSYLLTLGIPCNKEKNMYIWWRLESILHFLSRKNIYILIDAINENNKDVFLESFANQLEKLLRFHRIKVIVSCRSEYYIAKYRKHMITSGTEQQACYMDLQEDKYTYEARERLLFNYARHYGFSGDLSENVKEKIVNQLLLVRLFFEVYANKSEDVFELNKFELYKRYIELCDNYELKKMIQNLTKYMFDFKQYTNIPLTKITQAPNRYELIDSSILICRTIIDEKDKGTLLEEPEEVINFVFDEMRDYFLTRHMLNVYKDKNGNIDYSKVKKYVQELNKQSAQCLEGVTNYLFCHCISENNTLMINFLLFDLIKRRDDQIDAYMNRRNRHITSLGLSLLFETDSIDEIFGNKYVDYILQDNPGKEGQKLLVYLIKQEAMNGKYTLDILLNSFLRTDNKETFKIRIENTIAKWSGEGITVHHLVDVHKELKKTNAAGAERFAIYSFLLTSFFDWDNKTEVQEYFLKESSLAIDEYMKKLKEKIH